MKEKVLYIYGFKSNPKDSSTLKSLKEAFDNYEFVSITYNQIDPDKGLDTLEKYIRDNNIKYVIGHSLGGFIALCINEDVKKVVINPCMKPHLELPNLEFIHTEMLYNYEYLEGWLGSEISGLENVMGLFGDHDELIDNYESFKNRYGVAYRINADHRPNKEAYTEEIKTKIKEFFS